jgi:hypothetical protein
MSEAGLIVNDQQITAANYLRFHRRRIDFTINALRKLGAHRIVELGGHPWVMTSQLIDDGQFEVTATVSAEEITSWPDDIGVTRHQYRMRTLRGKEVLFPNYSANVERTQFEIDEQPDTVIACEIIEHLVRSPHIMLLNINRWLPIGGNLLVTTPNGAQFSNPFRRKASRPAYRCNVYARHNGGLTRDQLVDLLELCGFVVRESGFWNVYQRSGPTQVYAVLGALPSSYLKEKFRRTIFVSAEKKKDVNELVRLPKCYVPAPEWEFVRDVAKGTRETIVEE